MECFASPFVAAFGRSCIPHKDFVDSSIDVSKDLDSSHILCRPNSLQTVITDTSSSNSSSSKSSVDKVYSNISRTQANLSVLATSITDLDIVKTIGSGRFGFSHIVQCKITKVHAYLNIYQKSTLADTCQQHIPSREREIIHNLSHPFITKCLGSFQDESCLFMLLDLPRGGDLSRLLMSSSAFCSLPQKPLTEKQKMFYVACVLSVLKYIHAKDIIFRGLHPDTVLIDEYGYVKMVDWGFAKVVTDFTFTFCGHVEYLCPEAIVYDTGYGKGADYWAVGILVYEMLAGRSAFVTTTIVAQEGCCDGSTPMTAEVDDTQTVENIITKEVEFPSHFSESSRSLVSGLCQKNPSLRLGCAKNSRGIADIMSHAWFEGMDWDKLDRRELVPPWIPQYDGISQLKYFGGDYVQEEAVRPFQGYHHKEWNSFN